MYVKIFFFAEIVILFGFRLESYYGENSLKKVVGKVVITIIINLPTNLRRHHLELLDVFSLYARVVY